MSKGVYTFRGGTDRMIGLAQAELRRNGVDARIRAGVDAIRVEGRKAVGVTVNGRTIRARAVISNANLKGTIFHLIGPEHFDADFVEQARAVRLNNSSTQVYMALRPGETIDEAACGDLLFTSTAPLFRTESLLSRNVTSRTYSFYYPKTRPGTDRSLIVASTNARYEDWAGLDKASYRCAKQDLIETTLDAVSKYVPDIRRKLAWVECATPVTFARYTRHLEGASFGTKFEGLAVSRGLPQQIEGLYHAGSVGIIMSGWLGAVNYGVIVANEVDTHLMNGPQASAVDGMKDEG
jgi:phytoene dehydrogenase-like protein